MDTLARARETTGHPGLPDRQVQVLNAAGATDVGRRRRVNEDRFHVDAASGVFIVVDGLGGQAAGDRVVALSAARRDPRRSRAQADRRLRACSPRMNTRLGTG